MSFFDKKYSIWFLLIIYVLSYFMQSWFFVDAGSITTESVQKRTHLVAVIVDKDIYQNLKSDVEWYATEYIQNQISDSKAIILPITTKNFRANEITKMLENMYFDGEK
ncbi:TPA: hypothetical protein DEP21_05875 [Patescibacteria group bacterium]|nr:hypothetical protein [Candidatus Gracilibacteria bacterium]